MFNLGKETPQKIKVKEIKEIINQINHYVDLRGMDSRIWDETTGEWIHNPHNETIEQLTLDLRKSFINGKEIGVNWNKLPQRYQVWLNGYLSV